MKEIIGALKAYGIDVERKTIYADIEALRQFGLDIIGVREGNTHYYHIGGRDLELED